MTQIVLSKHQSVQLTINVLVSTIILMVLLMKDGPDVLLAGKSADFDLIPGLQISNPLNPQ